MSTMPLPLPITTREVTALVHDVMKNALLVESQVNADGTVGTGTGVTLDLSRKGIQSLPIEAVDIFKVEVERLALSHNYLTTLPLQFSECSSLRYLNIKANSLRNFPMAICGLKSLEILDIAKNKLRKLPEDLANLSSLKVLAVAKNRIEELPLCLGNMELLQVVKCDNNPISFPPKEVMEAPTEGQLNESRMLKQEDIIAVAVTEEIKKFLRKAAMVGQTVGGATKGEHSEAATEESPASRLRPTSEEGHPGYDGKRPGSGVMSPSQLRSARSSIWSRRSHNPRYTTDSGYASLLTQDDKVPFHATEGSLGHGIMETLPSSLEALGEASEETGIASVSETEGGSGRIVTRLKYLEDEEGDQQFRQTAAYAKPNTSLISTPKANMGKSRQPRHLENPLNWSRVDAVRDSGADLRDSFLETYTKEAPDATFDELEKFWRTFTTPYAFSSSIEKGSRSNDAGIDIRNQVDDRGQDVGRPTNQTRLEVPSHKSKAYISLLADDLLNKTLTEELDEKSIGGIHDALPQLLVTFASKVGSSNTLPAYQNLMIFVWRHKDQIAQDLVDKYIKKTISRSNILQHRTDIGDRVVEWALDTFTLDDPMTSLNEKLDDIMDGNRKEKLGEGKEATDFFPELSAYTDFLSKLPAYKWLIESIQKTLYMDFPGYEEHSIKEQILECLPRTDTVGGDFPPRAYSMTFTADWDASSFLLDQGYKESPERAVERAITITGSRIDAQAVTTSQYLNQTWPSSGSHLLHILRHVVRDATNIPYSHKLPDGTQLCVWSAGSPFTLEVNGIAESIAEIGEQLGWLGSALRSSPYPAGIAFVNPFLSDMGPKLSEERGEESDSVFFCNINFNVDIVDDDDDDDEAPNGQCWHQLFRNPVAVKGYPIPRRPTGDTGLEISLDTMAALTETHHINIFNNKLFIKGFSTMLVPTGQSGNILVWHLLHKKNGRRISYVDSGDYHVKNINLFDLETSRHILGWSSKVKYLAGSADAYYAIDRSWLRGLHETSKLKDISLTQGRLIRSDHTAALGKKDIAPQISRGTYRAKLDALSKKYVVLWDVECKRGWLVNGTSALLHLVRASLEFNKTDDLSFAFLFKPENFKEARNPHTVSAAMEVLMDPANLNMELYDEGEKDDSNSILKFCVRDRINELYGMVEKIIDYQIMISGTRGEGLKLAPRKDLEGWDFKDIATNEDPIYPSLAKLKTAGKGWVDFTRALQAVTLFGRNFGDLLDPVAHSYPCDYWKTVPSNKYYLAVSMEDLSRIMDRLGHPRVNPPRLTRSMVWHPSKIASGTKCPCSTGKEEHCELAQTIWPLHMSQILPKSNFVPLRGIGAVIFGHNTGIGWIWDDIGDPIMGELPTADEDSDDDPEDSGIGLSVGSPPALEPQEQLQFSPLMHALKHEDYKIAIICALPKELLAVRALFDHEHQRLSQHENDTNTYALGRLGNHNVVAACLPYAEYGMNAAAKVASDMEKSFGALKWYFVVGIGGGVPSRDHDIRLGDVVVSTGVIQHDMGKSVQKGSAFQNTGIVQRPARALLTAVSLIQSEPNHCHDFLDRHVQRVVSWRPEYQNPGEEEDRLFAAHSRHEDDQETCLYCSGPEVYREPRPPGPHVHYGLIASGNRVMKDAIARDQIAAERDILCFEMEGAGVMTTGQCLVIRGICDYADSHKNDAWHNYAAATAAAYTKYFLLRMRSLDMLNVDGVCIRSQSSSIIEGHEF